MQRPARLQAAAAWRAGYDGKNIVRGYARWFGVDLLCAIIELRLLGVAVDESYEQEVRGTIAAWAALRARRSAEELAATTRSFEPDLDWPVEWTPADEPAPEVDELLF